MSACTATTKAIRNELIQVYVKAERHVERCSTLPGDYGARLIRVYCSGLLNTIRDPKFWLSKENLNNENPPEHVLKFQALVVRRLEAMNNKAIQALSLHVRIEENSSP